MLGTAELVEGRHQSLIVKEKEQEAFPPVEAQSSVPVGVTVSDMTIPEESQRAGPTQVQSKPIMLNGR